MLGHGAGGGIDAPDLIAATQAARANGWSVARVLQPYRVAGRRSPAPAQQLDTAMAAVVAVLRRRRGMRDVALVLGGRSSGARVACRTATALDAQAVIALAFPLHPPGRPDRSRADELADAGVLVRVVQGDRDAFGSADDIAALHLAHVQVCAVPAADHALRTRAAADLITTAVGEVLTTVS